jgi:alkaline phosphatase
VALFARGPGADVVRGSIEQNEIYHIMRRALGF